MAKDKKGRTRKAGVRKKQTRLPQHALVEDAPPGSLTALLSAHLKWLAMHGYAKETVSTRRLNVRWFTGWAKERGIEKPAEVSLAVVESYQRWLFEVRTKNDKPLSFGTQACRLSNLKCYFRWLVREGHLEANPASELLLPRLPKRLPRQVLTRDEAEQVMALPDVTDPVGLRDRAILETFYATGIRRAELAALTVVDVDYGRGTLLIREGKGKKDRIIPAGERCLHFLSRYSQAARPELLLDSKEQTLFLTVRGEPMTLGILTRLAGRYVDEAALTKRGSCHLFRHTMATLMLEGGADVRYIQAMLGHADLSSREVYTRVAVRNLAEVHAASHPGAAMESLTKPRADGLTDVAAPGDEDTTS